MKINVFFRVLYQAFINTFNIIIDNFGYFMGKWKGQLEGEDILRKVIDKRFIAAFQTTSHIDQFGAGKTFLSCAFGIAACRNFYTVKYIRLIFVYCRKGAWKKIKDIEPTSRNRFAQRYRVSR